MIVSAVSSEKASEGGQGMPMEEFRLRPLAVEEAALARNPIEAAWPEALAAAAQEEIQSLPQSFRAAGGEFWLAEYRQIAIGAVGAFPRRAREWEVRWLCLLPRWRRLGLGAILLQRAMAFVEERRGHRLLCAPPTAEARAFLRAAGFAELEPEERGLMARDLTPAANGL
ncbi:MAG: GNAT family N-acetyltransferase [Planctomycetota bacterium]|nr:GNAT family N-acetyltransferase [Planctomycetota bacterium]